jgi:hypothetical protein
VLEFIALTKQADQSILAALALHALNFLAVTVGLGLVAIDLLLLLVVGILMTLQLVANQRARA